MLRQSDPALGSEAEHGPLGKDDELLDGRDHQTGEDADQDRKTDQAE